MYELGFITMTIGAILFFTQNTISKFISDKKKKEFERDTHIEFGAGQGEGIELVKKQYPDLELKDDHRTGIEDANKS